MSEEQVAEDTTTSGTLLDASTPELNEGEYFLSDGTRATSISLSLSKPKPILSQKRSLVVLLARLKMAIQAQKVLSLMMLCCKS